MTSAPLVSPRTPRWAIATAISIGALYVVSRLWMRQVEPGSLQSILAALLPLPVLFWFYTAWVLQLLRSDELVRRIALEGLAIGFGVTFAVVLLLAQLENAVPPGALWPDFGDIAVVALISTFAGVARARRRYE